jgi:uncharacterized damage-inducible protein DinB
MSTQLAASTEIDRIADQLERAFEGDAWHGRSLSDILSRIDAEQAAARPIAGAHTIWEIVTHITAWQRTVRECLSGEPLLPLPEAQNWPPIEDTSEAAWGRALADLRAEYERLREAVLAWRDRDLGERVEGKRYTVYEMLHGVIQHDLYHAGQIALLERGTAG